MPRVSPCQPQRRAIREGRGIWRVEVLGTWRERGRERDSGYSITSPECNNGDLVPQECNWGGHKQVRE